MSRPLFGTTSGEAPFVRDPREPAEGGAAPVVRYAYFVFLAAIPYETIDVGFGAPVSLSKIAGWVFFLTTLLQPSLCWRRPPAPVWLFGGYLAVLGVLGVVGEPRHATDIAVRFQQQVQMLAFFWCSANLLQVPRVATGALGAVAASCAVLGVLQLTGITAASAAWGDVERVSTLAEDPNNAALVLSLGLLCGVGLTLGRRVGDSSTSLAGRLAAAVALSALLLVPIMRTGSRGNLVGLGAGLSVLALSGWKARLRWLRIPLAAALLAGAAAAALRTDAMRVRMERAVVEKSASGREEIIPQAVAMFLEQPLAGWGPVENVYELGRRVGAPRKDTHNVYLWVVTETGLLGGLPFLLGMALCVRAAVRARKGGEGLAPLSLAATLLVVEMGTTDHNRKLFWFVLAYAVASGSRRALGSRDEPEDVGVGSMQGLPDAAA